jgi:hypothetical protein
MYVGDYDRLLLVLMVQLLRGPRQPQGGTVEEMGQMLRQLQAHYEAAGTPYGDDVEGFQRWLLDLWPAPKVA